MIAFKTCTNMDAEFVNFVKKHYSTRVKMYVICKHTRKQHSTFTLNVCMRKDTTFEFFTMSIANFLILPHLRMIKVNKTFLQIHYYITTLFLL